jgi:hypothetical protein
VAFLFSKKPERKFINISGGATGRMKIPWLFTFYSTFSNVTDTETTEKEEKNVQTYNQTEKFD